MNVMAADDDTITVGFSQVGAESDWRTANTESMKSTFSEDNGYELIFDDAQQKQENQLTAIRNFIQQEVDYIVLAPVTETGWDTVLQEAKDAGIPVIIVDFFIATAFCFEICIQPCHSFLTFKFEVGSYPCSVEAVVRYIYLTVNDDNRDSCIFCFL